MRTQGPVEPNTRDPRDPRLGDDPGGAGQESSQRSAARALGIVVVNYASHDLIEANLGAVDFGTMGVRVIVVDNYSTEDERHSLRVLAAARGWDLLALDTNRGFGGGVNEGVHRARASGCASVLLLNPDAIATPEVIAELHAESVRVPDSMITPRIVDSDGRVFFAGSEVSLRDGSIRNAVGEPDGRVPPDRGFAWLTAACLVTSCELLERIGGFDESYFLYWEDVDLSYRAQLAGARLIVRDDLVVVHDEGGTQGPRRGGAKSDLYYYYNCRNRLVFAARNLGRRDLCSWILRTPAASWQILVRGGRRRLVYSPRRLLATIRGTLSGVVTAILALLCRPTSTTRAPARGWR